MFRLNGDIIKQLENLYEIKFLPKYKEELKDRILSFVHSIVKLHLEENIFETLHKISGFLIIEHNRPTIITNQFFVVYKEELFNSFNPLWYKQEIKTTKHLSKTDFDHIVSNFIRSSCNELRFLEEKGLRPFDHFERTPEYIFHFKIDYSTKFYKKIYLNLKEQFELSLDNEFYKDLFKEKDFLEFKEKVIIFSFSDSFFTKFLADLNIYLYDIEKVRFLSKQFLYSFFLYEIMIKAKNKAWIS